MDKLGITMIGASGTGKTCYLYAMADAMQIGSCNFTFTATPYKVSLELQLAWDGLLDGKWPKGSVESAEYEFVCSYALRKLATFSWYDYRGGILTNPDDASEQAALFGRMDESRCLIACISAEAIHGILNNDLKSRRIFSVYMGIIQKYRIDTGNTVPIVFAITKADLLEPGEFNKGVELIRTKFMTALFAEDREGGWYVAFVPVSLGTGLSKGPNEEVLGTIEPANVHIPVLIAVECAIAELLAEKEIRLSDVNSALHRRQEEKDRNGRRGWFDKFWNGDQSEEIESAIGYLASDKSDLRYEIAGLKDDLNKLRQEIGQCQMVVYSNGKKIK